MELFNKYCFKNILFLRLSSVFRVQDFYIKLKYFNAGFQQHKVREYFNQAEVIGKNNDETTQAPVKKQQVSISRSKREILVELHYRRLRQ